MLQDHASFTSRTATTPQLGSPTAHLGSPGSSCALCTSYPASPTKGTGSQQGLLEFTPRGLNSSANSSASQRFSRRQRTDSYMSLANSASSGALSLGAVSCATSLTPTPSGTPRPAPADRGPAAAPPGLLSAQLRVQAGLGVQTLVRDTSAGAAADASDGGSNILGGSDSPRKGECITLTRDGNASVAVGGRNVPDIWEQDAEAQVDVAGVAEGTSGAAADRLAEAEAGLGGSATSDHAAEASASAGASPPARPAQDDPGAARDGAGSEDRGGVEEADDVVCDHSTVRETALCDGQGSAGAVDDRQLDTGAPHPPRTDASAPAETASCARSQFGFVRMVSPRRLFRRTSISTARAAGDAAAQKARTDEAAPEDLTVLLPESGAVGIVNPGVLCFRNAVMQVRLPITCACRSVKPSACFRL